MWSLGLLGAKLYFHSLMIPEMPDNVVQDLIAHELSHVYQWASDISFRRRI